MNMVALIPARAGSKRVPGKNTRLLGGLPLLVWTIRAAQRSGVFDGVIVSSDDEEALVIADQNGACASRRPMEQATYNSPDIQWVRHILPSCERDAFAILRPTSPFRTAETIQRAFKQFTHHEVHSIRAVQPVTEHPAKMWQRGNGCIYPLFDKQWIYPHGVPMDIDPEWPWHSMPSQTLPEVYVQNASLEMAWTYVVKAFGTISGKKVSPFFTEGLEGFDINTEDDFAEAARIVAAHPEMIPHVHQQTEA